MSDPGSPRRARRSGPVAAAALALLIVPAAEAAIPEGAKPAEVQVATGDVRACAILSGGEVVAAGAGGLVLLDGELRPRRVLTALDGLPGTAVHAVMAGDDGALWVGAEGGLARVRVRGAAAVVERAWPMAPVHALLAFEGHVVAATWGGGVVAIDEHDQAWPVGVVAAGKQGRITALLFDGELVAATASEGLWRVNELRLEPRDAELPSPHVFALARADGVLWAGTLVGLVAVGQGAHPAPAAALASADVRALARLDGRLVAATYGDGLRAVVDGAPVGPAEARFVVAIAQAGGATCAGGPDGLWVRRGAGHWRAARLGGLPSSDVTAIAPDGERLYAGTFDHGVAVREGGVWRPLVAKGVDARVDSLLVEGGRVWIGTPRGLFVIAGGRVRALGLADGLPSAHVFSLAALPGGGVIAGTGMGAVRVSPRLRVLDRHPMPALRTVWAVAVAADGSFWMGTSRGLYRQVAGRRPRRYSRAAGQLPDDWVTAIAVRGDTVWVGTYAGGVGRMTVAADGSAVGEALAGGRINPGGLLVDGEDLYAATMNGLLVRTAAGAGAWRTVAGAAPGDDVTAVTRAGGDLWVASRRGLARWAAPAAQ